MKKNIEFIATSKDVELLVTEPKPTKNYLPNWYKEKMPMTYKSLEFDTYGNVQTNVKNCIPFMDIMTSGYIQETWVDIEIKEKDGYIEYFYSGSSGNDAPVIMSHRKVSSIPVQEDFYPFEFIWNQAWSPKLPKGYSCIISHPYNRIELPFYTIGGIIDSDKFFNSSGGNLPFYIKKGFSGLIPAGTPMYQIIPFKRDNWTSSKKSFELEKTKINSYNLRKFFVGGYKKAYWSKKSFE